MSADLTAAPKRRVTLTAVGGEPFRLFFPAGVLAGLMGVALWPLHFLGVVEFYPGLGHARIMACGLFGGFILGFLGTAMPRMLSAKALSISQVLFLVATHICMVAAFAFSRIFLGDLLFLILVGAFVGLMILRARHRKDTPPPGFILVGLSFLCAIVGTVLAIAQSFRDFGMFWVTLQRLLSYQGFVLFPILGIGPFILPRLFGLQSEHDSPEARMPSANWWQKAALALATGVLILGSFFLEATGWYRAAYSVRFGAALGYIWMEMPFRRAPRTNALGLALRLAFAAMLAGFLAVALFPYFRVGLLHLTLVGGFAIITFVVATRVVFGHSGNAALLNKRNRWLLIAVGLMLLGTVTRISGDVWPKVLPSHYSYGAVLWIAGVLIWAARVLPFVWIAESTD